jgi:hypothetical protein
MVSPVWYNIRRVGIAQYHVSGEHDVDVNWMNEVRATDSRGDIVGRILPRFAVEGWDREAYQELATNVVAQTEFTKLIVQQIKYLSYKRC